jgi:hypothetical protein
MLAAAFSKPIGDGSRPEEEAKLARIEFNVIKELQLFAGILPESTDEEVGVVFAGMDVRVSLCVCFVVTTTTTTTTTTGRGRV